MRFSVGGHLYVVLSTPYNGSTDKGDIMQAEVIHGSLVTKTTVAQTIKSISLR